MNTALKYNSSLPIEWIVVDNASGDDSEEKIREKFPQVKWIAMGYNAGFARGNNAGIRAAGGEAVLLLNPDTLSIDDSITRCYQRLQASAYAATGVQQLNVDGSPQISGNFFVRGGLNHLLPLPYWGDLVRWAGYKAGTKVPNVPVARKEEKVDWISGAFLMVKKDAFSKAGLLDEDFFLYAEEVEWCSRLNGAGPLCIFGDLHIIHLEGGSINKEQGAPQKGYANLFDKKGLQLMVSNHLRVRKQYGRFWFLFLLLNYTWGLVFFAVCSTLHHIFRMKNPFTDWDKVGAFGGNLARLWSLVPRIISGRPHFYKMF